MAGPKQIGFGALVLIGIMKAPDALAKIVLGMAHIVFAFANGFGEFLGAIARSMT